MLVFVYVVVTAPTVRSDQPPKELKASFVFRPFPPKPPKELKASFLFLPFPLHLNVDIRVASDWVRQASSQKKVKLHT